MATAASGNSLRVIGGQWRSRKITFPSLEGLRPTGDRIRETLFNWLQSGIAGANCLDLFAGSGACGIEALSRAAASVVFVEKQPAAAQAIRDNLQKLGATGIQVVNLDAMQWLNSCGKTNAKKFDVVFIDPPFQQRMETAAALALEQSGCLSPGAKIYIETDRLLEPGELPSNWVRLKQKKAGAVFYFLLARRAATVADNP